MTLELCLKECPIIISEPLIIELFQALKLRAQAPYRWLRYLRIQIDARCERVELGELPNVVRDPKDNHIIAAAIAGQCQYLITGDKDLLSLAGSFNIAIITPAQVLNQPPDIMAP